jgi:hypothetical protein
VLAKRVPDQRRTIHSRPSGSSVCGAEQRRIQYDLYGFHTVEYTPQSNQQSTGKVRLTAPGRKRDTWRQEGQCCIPA